jgi:hypothetical protein
VESEEEQWVDQDTRIMLGFRQWYDHDKGIQVNVLECFYGYAVGEASALKPHRQRVTNFA